MSAQILTAKPPETLGTLVMGSDGTQKQKIEKALKGKSVLETMFTWEFQQSFSAILSAIVDNDEVYVSAEQHSEFTKLAQQKNFRADSINFAKKRLTSPSTGFSQLLGLLKDEKVVEYYKTNPSSTDTLDNALINITAYMYT